MRGRQVVSLRAAAAADADAVAALHTESWRHHYRGAYADSFLDGDVLSDRHAVWSRRLAAPGPERITILAEADAEVAGFVHVVLDEDERWGSLVDNLHVSGTRQRQGIGSALMAGAAQAVADRATSRSMYLWVLQQNLAAQAFYAARGGRSVERALAEPPGGVPGRLSGHPVKLRYAWQDARAVSGRPGADSPRFRHPFGTSARQHGGRGDAQ
jgi:ribosomal protein S18 acetylase RimI-like enzyme